MLGIAEPGFIDKISGRVPSGPMAPVRGGVIL